MRNRITVVAFRRALARLGFKSTRVPGSHVTFRHAPTGTLILLPTRRGGRWVTPQDVLSAHVVIAGRGVATAERFSAILAEASHPPARRKAAPASSPPR